MFKINGFELQYFYKSKKFLISQTLWNALVLVCKSAYNQAVNQQSIDRSITHSTDRLISHALGGNAQSKHRYLNTKVIELSNHKHF